MDIVELLDNVFGKRVGHVSQPATPKTYSKCDKLQLGISTTVVYIKIPL